MKNKLLSTIKNLDIQGYQINMGYRGEGNIHKTLLGAFVSSVIFLSIFKSTYAKTHDMLFHGNDSVSQYYSPVTNV